MCEPRPTISSTVLAQNSVGSLVLSSVPCSAVAWVGAIGAGAAEVAPVVAQAAHPEVSVASVAAADPVASAAQEVGDPAGVAAVVVVAAEAAVSKPFVFSLKQ